jgi:hypothetical protein
VVESLIAKGLSKRQVLQTVRNNQAHLEDVRQAASAMVERWPQDPGYGLEVPIGP